MPPEVNAPAPAPAPVPTPAPAPTAATPPPPAPTPAAPPPADGTLLGTVGVEATLEEKIPEKFRVKAADGKFDLAASVAKVEEHRAHLEKRAGTGDLPPKTADDYVVTVPEELKAAFDPSKDKLLAEFRVEAHKKGVTQGQFDFMMAEFFKRVPQIGDQIADYDRRKAEETMRAEWKDQATLEKNVVAGRRAVMAYAANATDAKHILDAYGNDPAIVRMMANVGAEIKEDKGVPAGSAMSELDFGKRASELRAEMAKLPNRDPRRVALQAELTGLYDRKYPSKAA